MGGRPDEREMRDRAAADVEVAVADLFRTGRTWSKEFARRFEPPLPGIAFGILRYLRIHGATRPGDIAGAFGLDKAAVSRQRAMLRESGLIEQTPDPADRRASLVVVSESAAATFDRLRLDVREKYAGIFADWETDDLERFATLLTRFTSRLP